MKIDRGGREGTAEVEGEGRGGVSFALSPALLTPVTVKI